MRKYLLPTIITLLLFGSLIQEKVKAQDITGTEFWFTPTGGRWYIDQSTKLMIVGNYDATITLDFVALPHPGGTTNEFSCTAQTYNHVGGTVTTVLIPSDNLVYCARYVDDLSAPETIQNNGCLINSDAPIAVYYTHYEAASGEATPLHPTSRLGQDYYINAYRENSTDSYWAAVANLIATEDNTQITVTLSDETWTSSGDYRTNGLDLTDTVVKHKPGETWTFTMNRGQTYSMTSLQDGTNSSSGNAFPWGSTVPNKWNTGLNGVRVQSNKNIAVFGGSPITRIGDYEYLGCSAGDITFTNLLPTNEWGTKFVATQTLLRTYNITGLNAQGPPSYVNYPPTSADKSTADYLLITAKDNGTIITIGGRSAFTYNMDAGDYIIYESPGKSAAAQLNPGQVQNTITSNNPISVTQLMKGGYCDGAVATNGGDPDQMWVFKEDDWTDNYLMSNPTDYTSNFLVLIVKEPNGGTEARNSIAVSQNGVNVAIPAGVSSSPLQDGTGGWSRMGTTNYWFQRVQLNTVGVPVKAKSIPLTPGGATYNFAFYMSGGLGAGSYGYMGGASCQLEAFASADGVPGCVGVPMDLNLDSTRNGGTLAGMNNYTYTWEVYNGTTLVHTFSGTGADPTYSYTPTVGGNLTVILDINDIAGCNARDTFQMFVNTRPDITDLADLTSCNNYLLPTIVGTDLTGNEAYYSGIGGTGTQFLPGSTITNGGTYYLYDSHSAACFDEEETAITINSSPIVNPASITTTCDAANVEYILEFTVSGGNGGPYTVTEIAPGGTGGSFTGAVYTTNAITSGVSYNFEVTDANGCPAAVVSGVKNCLCTSAAGTMSTTALSLCGDGNQSTTAGSVGPTLDGNDAMSFVLHTNSGGNLGTVLASNAGPNFSFLSGTMTYGTTYYISRVVGNDDGTGLVDLTDGCLSVASGTPVVWKEAVSAVISNNGPVCSGTSSSIDFSMTGPAPFNIVYNNGTSNQNILNATSNHNRVVTPTSTTTYTIVSVTSVANGCAANTSVGNSTSLIVNDQPIATNKLEDCDASNSNYRVSFDVSQGQAPYTVIVNSPAGIGGTFTGTTWTSDLIPSGTAYDFSLSDNNMCGATAITGQRTCLCLSESGAMVQAVLSTCGDGIQTAQQDPSQSPFLDANDALVFILHDSPNDVAGTILDVSLSPSFAFNSATMTYGTTYYISAVVGNNDGNGMVDPSDPCADVAFGTPVVWDEIPVAVASYNDPLCSGNTMQLFGSNANDLPGTTYTWMGNMNYFSSVQNPTIANVNAAMTGNMVLTAINGNCSSDATLAVQVTQSATASFDPELLNGVTTARHYQFNNNSANANSYTWNFGDGESNTEESPSHQYLEENAEAIVTLIAFGENGCNDTLSIPVDLTVYPEMDTVLIFMPNSFTPDGNEYNQYFGPVFNESVDVTSYTMSIYNRWGQKIFESNDLEIGWDGSFESQLVQSGVYTWVVSFTDKYTFKTYNYEGHINLLK